MYVHRLSASNLTELDIFYKEDRTLFQPRNVLNPKILTAIKLQQTMVLQCTDSLEGWRIIVKGIKEKLKKNLLSQLWVHHSLEPIAKHVEVCGCKITKYEKGCKHLCKAKIVQKSSEMYFQDWNKNSNEIAIWDFLRTYPGQNTQRVSQQNFKESLI